MKPDFEAIRARLNAATSGPWTVTDFCQAPATEKHPAVDTCKVRPIQRTALGSLKRPDAVFIAHARQDVQDLLDYIEELERSSLTR